MDRSTDGPMDRWTDGPMDRGTDGPEGHTDLSSVCPSPCRSSEQPAEGRRASPSVHRSSCPALLNSWRPASVVQTRRSPPSLPLEDDAGTLHQSAPPLA